VAQRTAAWSVRALLAACLLLTAEILLWTAPTRALADWPPLVAGYLALAALTLDLAQRWRARDLFGLLLLAGLLATVGSAALFPQRALADLPLTLVTRAMGAYALGFALALALGLKLLGGPHRRLLAAILIGGLAWGAWARGLPSLTDAVETAPVSLLLAGTVALALIGVARWLVGRAGAQLSAADLRLDRISGALILAALVWNLLRAHDSGALGSLALTACAALAVYCLLLLWFQQRGRTLTPLEAALPAGPAAWSWLAGGAALFLLGGLVGYSLPAGGSGLDAAGLLALAFTAYGLVWLPTVSLVLGVKGWRRLTRQRRL
jgi:hypothetical protein